MKRRGLIYVALLFLATCAIGVIVLRMDWPLW